MRKTSKSHLHPQNTEPHPYQHLRDTAWHYGAMIYTLVPSKKKLWLFWNSLAHIFLWSQKKEQHVWNVENKPGRWVFITDTDKHALVWPCKSERVPYNVAITAVKAYVLLGLCSSGGYTSRVMVKSSHMVACINWKGHRGAYSPGSSKTPLSSPAMLASGHAFKLYIDDSPW